MNNDFTVLLELERTVCASVCVLLYNCGATGNCPRTVFPGSQWAAQHCTFYCGDFYSNFQLLVLKRELICTARHRGHAKFWFWFWSIFRSSWPSWPYLIKSKESGSVKIQVTTLFVDSFFYFTVTVRLVCSISRPFSLTVAVMTVISSV